MIIWVAAQFLSADTSRVEYEVRWQTSYESIEECTREATTNALRLPPQQNGKGKPVMVQYICYEKPQIEGNVTHR
jgi:hypothetical protein